MDQVGRSLAERMHPAIRILLLILASILALFVVGFFIGFGVSTFDQGHLPRKPIAWALLGGGAVASYAIYRSIRALLPASLTAEMTSFDRRYARMWLIICLLGVPIGAALALMVLRGDPQGAIRRIFVDGSLPAAGALALSAALVAAFATAAVLYHRAIDDHEERAYLWGSQAAYYSLAAAIPVYWLLWRGELVPALTAGGAMLMLLASFIVQAAVWAWFKFR